MMQIWGAARDWDVFCETLADARRCAAGRAGEGEARCAQAAAAVADSTAFHRRSCGCCAGCIGIMEIRPPPARKFGRFARQTLARLHARLIGEGASPWRDERRRRSPHPCEAPALRRDFFSGCAPGRAAVHHAPGVASGYAG
jgi:hypothetical protein